MSPSATSSNASAPPPVSSPSSVPESPGLGLSALALNNDAAGPSSNVSPPLSSPSFPSASSHQAVSQNPSVPRSMASPPTGPTASTSAAAGSSSGQLNPTLPSRTTQLHVAEARAALVASVSNMVDSELQSRASLMHSNAGVLTKQSKDVERATASLRKENDKLEKMAKDAGRKIKEIGNVQNWAEVLERDFLVLEETMRLVKRGSSQSGSESCSQCSGSSWSGSDTGGSRVGSTTSSRRASVVDEEPRGSVASANNGVVTVAAAKSHEPVRGRDSDGDVNMDDGTTAGQPNPIPSMSTGTTVAVDEAIAASINEAMATYVGDAMITGMHEAPAPPDLTSPSAGQASPSKGKEPAVVDDRMEIDAAELGSREFQQTSATP
ncbi:hypothetical protein F4779DRAFT_613766 [Xylariaceae sp. FL0662B]|nr:hypothetical protein F4779DRAFT_613766 [Xylariaceae sp. FL0662B]